MTSNIDTTSYPSLGVFGAGNCSIGVFRYVNFDRNAGSRFACAFAMESTSELGSIAVTEAVVGNRAADSANIPPPQPISRYFMPVEGDVVSSGTEERQERMKSWRRGFMR